MYVTSLEEAKRISKKTKKIASTLKKTETVICPPFVFIAPISSKKPTENFSIGSQSVSYKENGSGTGQISASMLQDLKVKYPIIGHSEERAAGDTDETVSKRIIAALNVGLTPIVCIGEKVRDENGDYLETLKSQIKATLANIPKKLAKNIIVAYEPVWAIGAKEAMVPEQVHETSIFVKKVFNDVFGPGSANKLKVLYGGSVNFRNASDIIRIGKVDGLLVGRESANIPGFIELLKAVDSIL